jgi:hypothetical protein
VIGVGGAASKNVKEVRDDVVDASPDANGTVHDLAEIIMRDRGSECPVDREAAWQRRVKRVSDSSPEGSAAAAAERNVHAMPEYGHELEFGTAVTPRNQRP